jgi:hypothetical protein
MTDDVERRPHNLRNEIDSATLQHLQSDLGPFMDAVDAISSQTDDPVLTEAADRVHDSLSALLAEIAVMIYRARQHSRT